MKLGKKNWEFLREGLNELQDFFEFALPTHAIDWSHKGFIWDNTGCRTDCSWFGFMIRVRDKSPFNVVDLANHLDESKIGSRMLFGGNLVRQPAFIELNKQRPGSFRVVGKLNGANILMKNTLFLGTYPGLTREMLEYIIDSIKIYVNKF